MERLGNDAMRTLISSTIVQRRMAWRKFSSSNWPSVEKNWPRLSEAKLHAVSSRNMYSEQGLEALIRPSSGQVCHSLMVVSYCVPGSAQIQAAQAIWSQRSRAFMILETLPSIRRLSCQSPSTSKVLKKWLGTRTLLFEFWPDTVW